jgi:hypothetical protein
MLQRVAVALACVGILAPQIFAAAPQATQAAPAVLDVALSSGGVLQGTVVNAQGVAQPGIDVYVGQQGQLIATTRTNDEGQFVVSSLRGGVYQIATSGSNGIYRLWAAQTAPPAAQAKLLVVNDGQIALGQCCDDGSCGGCCGSGWGLLGNPWVLGGIVAAAIAIPLALDEAS